MKGVMLDIGQTKSGGYKVYIWGHDDNHISDWRGCNYRFKPLPNQPLRGFKTVQEAIDHIKREFPSKEQFNRWCDRCGDGQFLSDDKFNMFTKKTNLSTRTHWDE